MLIMPDNLTTDDLEELLEDDDFDCLEDKLDTLLLLADQQ